MCIECVRRDNVSGSEKAAQLSGNPPFVVVVSECLDFKEKRKETLIVSCSVESDEQSGCAAVAGGLK